MMSCQCKLGWLIVVLMITDFRAAAQDCLWTKNTPLPGGGIGSLVVFDTDRGVSTFLAADGLWSWDGSEWSFVWAPYPSIGGEAHVAYDSSRQVIVLHGNSKTLEFNGATWNLISESGPSPRSGFRIVYDSVRDRTVLHGGRNNSGYLNDTWEWDGAAWTQQSTSGPFRGFYAAAFDSLRQRVVIFGGRDQNSQNQRNLWDWDGTSWSQLAENIGPYSNQEEMVFDAKRGVLVLSHAENGWENIWEWDGATFLHVPAYGPYDRSYSGLVYDAQRQKTILYGGSNHRDHWEWDGVTWTLIGGLTPTSAYFTYNRSDALVQGVSLCCGAGKIWTYQGPDWSFQQAEGPELRREFAIAFDEARHKIVLFGGRNTSGNPHVQYGDTWEWDGASWTQIMVSGPPARAGHTMVYDPAREMIVMFGGYITDAEGWNWDEFGDTWGWDGTAWTHLSSSGPSPRYWHAMAYDRVRQTTLLFGGSLYTGLGGPGYGDLWSWDGINWTLLSNPGQNKPGTGYNYSFVFDESRGVGVLVSGGWFSDTGGVAYTKTWEWDGANWSLPVASGSPRGPALYDAARARTLLIDNPDTWEYPMTAMPPLAPVAESVKVNSVNVQSTKNRYLSFIPPAVPPDSSALALRVTATQLPGPVDCPNVGDFSGSFQSQMWVGPEVLSGGVPTGLFKLTNTPVFRDWATVPGGVIHVADCNIVPCATYAVEALADTPCDVGTPSVASEAILISTSAVWGDVVGGNGVPVPDGLVDFFDISTLVNCFRNIATALPGTWCDLAGNNPYQGVNLSIDFSDIALIVGAFRGESYPFPGPTAPTPCP